MSGNGVGVLDIGVCWAILLSSCYIVSCVPYFFAFVHALHSELRVMHLQEGTALGAYISFLVYCFSSLYVAGFYRGYLITGN